MLSVAGQNFLREVGGAAQHPCARGSTCLERGAQHLGVLARPGEGLDAGPDLAPEQVLPDRLGHPAEQARLFGMAHALALREVPTLPLDHGCATIQATTSWPSSGSSRISRQVPSLAYRPRTSFITTT